jgi:hypothetical protein
MTNWGASPAKSADSTTLPVSEFSWARSVAAKLPKVGKSLVASDIWVPTLPESITSTSSMNEVGLALKGKKVQSWPLGPNKPPQVLGNGTLTPPGRSKPLPRILPANVSSSESLSFSNVVEDTMESKEARARDGRCRLSSKGGSES